MNPGNRELIYHICRREEWGAAQAAGRYAGSSQDRADGFIHFSDGAQVAASAAKHRAGQDGLVLLTVEAAALGDALKWEASRGGALFPHLYGDLPLAAVRRVDALPLGPDGQHRFPDGFAPDGFAPDGLVKES
ncbi:MAG: DUF952 domain-containing protein [Kiloniellaceae bacterium]